MSYLVVNISKKQFIRPAAFGEADDFQALINSYEGVMLGLVVLLADGNNRGGGDLRSDALIIGSWAGDRIVIVDEAFCDASLSEPGMEAVPLQEQLLQLGQDVSGEVIDAILEGEGDYSRLAKLNVRSVIPLVEQSKLQDAQAGAVLTEEGRAQPLMHLEELYYAFAAEMALSQKRCLANLQQGINQMASAFGRAERYQVKSVATQTGVKIATVQHMFARSGETKRMQGVVRADVTLASETGEHVVSINFGESGTTIGQLYEALFPGIVFERPIELSTSPEVAKLLSFLNATGKESV